MNNRVDIKNEPFIPDGLEFKSEYMDSAMAMYEEAKKKRLWNKFYVALACFLLICVVSTVSLLKKSKESMPAQTANSMNNNLNDAAFDQNQVGENKSEIFVEGDRTSIGETQVVNNRGPEMTTSKKTTLDKKILEKSGLSGKTSDLGGSESSGSELPGRMSNIKMRFDHSSHALQDASEVNSLLLVSEGSTQQTNQEQVIRNDSGNPMNNMSLNQVQSEIEINKENNLLDQEIAERIEFIPIFFKFKEAQLCNTTVIPSRPDSKWLGYFSIGFIPIAGYGSSNNQWKPDPVIHAGVGYKFHHGMSVNLAGRYFNISGLSHPYTVEKTTFGQGFKTNSETYYTDGLHYAGVNIGVSKTWQNRHVLTIGYNLDYLITGNNYIVAAEISTFENKQFGSRKVSGFVEGFADLNHSMQLGYEYCFGRSNAIGMNFQYGLTDITKDHYFVDARVHRNSLLSLYFRMNFNK